MIEFYSYLLFVMFDMFTFDSFNSFNYFRKVYNYFQSKLFALLIFKKTSTPSTKWSGCFLRAAVTITEDLPCHPTDHARGVGLQYLTEHARPQRQRERLPPDPRPDRRAWPVTTTHTISREPPMSCLTWAMMLETISISVHTDVVPKCYDIISDVEGVFAVFKFARIRADKLPSATPPPACRTGHCLAAPTGPASWSSARLKSF